MSFDTIFEGTSVRVAPSVAFPAPALRIVPAAVARSGPGAASGGGSEDRLEVGAGGWIACRERWGVVEIHDSRLFRRGHEAFCRALAELAIERFRARRVEIRLASSMCRLEFEPGEFSRAELCRRVAEAVKAATPTKHQRTGVPAVLRASWTILTARATDGGVSIRRRREDHPGRVVLCDTPAPAQRAPGVPVAAPRLVDLALAGGSLVMAVAGAILPGIPSLPFLLLATRHAARLSPGLDRFVRRQPWAAALLGQAESLENLLGLDRGSLLRMLAIGVIAVAVLLIAHPPWPIVMGLELGVMAFICLRQIAQKGEWNVAMGSRGL
jgi:uncharacterized protein